MRVLSGIQPSGKLHLGNYFGMMKQCVDLQKKGEVYVFIANYHALTTVSDPARLRQDTMDVAIDFLACGLDPAHTVFFRQSDVPEVQELTWLLSIVCPVGLLERAHSYKDKLAHGKEAAESAAETARRTFEEGAKADSLPTVELPRVRLKAGIAAFELMHEAGLADSRNEARKLIKGGGGRLNDRPIANDTAMVGEGDLDSDGTLKLSAGRKRHVLVRAV